ncbi:hypothetical protein, partial [Pseudomonas putida]|uniref:hypothetical protein n=1 Tax=Pseudomonas putida TaxID=303 RepID=UPI001E28A5E8
MLDLMDAASVDKAQIVYEDECIVVVWQPGRSNFILVTFGDLANLANGVDLYAGVPARKLGLTCIGFMAKKPNWFPPSNVEKAISSIQKYFFGFNEIVTYGGSMGGYAAIKYSSALKATSVAAFCPQWTIDKNECSGRNPGYQEHFLPTMTGMGIKSQDISGSVFIFFDPTHDNDKYHANVIRSKAGVAKYVPVRSVGHHVTSVLAGTDNMGAILNMVRAGDHLGLCRLSNKIRKRHYTTATFLLPRIAKKHPKLLKKIIFNPELDKSVDQYDVIRLKTDALKLFSEQVDVGISLEAVESIQSHGICPVRSAMLDSYRGHLRDQLSLQSRALNTAHGSIIAYSAVHGNLVHRSKAEVLSSIYLYPVVLHNYQGNIAFGIRLNNRDYLCQVTSKESPNKPSVMRESPQHLIRAAHEPDE